MNNNIEEIMLLFLNLINMRYPALAILLMIFYCTAQAQSIQNPTYFLWDKEWKNVTEQGSAIFFSRLYKTDEGKWILENYNVNGPMLSSGTYSDKEAKNPDGRFIYYNSRGYIDSLGNMIGDKQDGHWYYYNQSRVGGGKTYKDGLLKRSWDTESADSTAKAEKDDTEVESTFKGGGDRWVKYLSGNVKFPPKVLNKTISGQVISAFVVGEDGKVIDAFLVKSVEFTLDDELLRVIRNSPKWKPGEKGGQKVKTYKLQPLIFRVN